MGLFDNFFAPQQPIKSPVPADKMLENGPRFANGTQTVSPLPEESDSLVAISLPSKNSDRSFPFPTSTPAPNQPEALNNLAPLPNDPGTQYNDIISNASKSHGVPAAVLKGMLAHESMQFNPKYVGGYHTDGSGRGVAAIDKNAHPEITDEQAFDPKFAIPWAAKVLAAYKQQEGSWTNALRRYNGGGNYAANVPGYAGVPVNQRTQNYAMNVLKQAHHFAGQ